MTWNKKINQKMVTRFAWILILSVIISCSRNNEIYEIFLEKDETITSSEFKIIIRKNSHFNQAQIIFHKQSRINSNQFDIDSLSIPVNSEVLKYADSLVHFKKEIQEEMKQDNITIMDGAQYHITVNEKKNESYNYLVTAPSARNYTIIQGLISELFDLYELHYKKSLTEINFSQEFTAD